jgi:hypothetical protein
MPLLALPTLIAAIGAAAGIGGTIVAAKSGADQNAAQQKALQNQKNAQAQAEADTLSNQRRSETAQNAVNAKTPDVASILSRAAQSGKAGVNGTMLTGPTGIDPTQLNLGKATLLGS